MRENQSGDVHIGFSLQEAEEFLGVVAEYTQSKTAVYVALCNSLEHFNLTKFLGAIDSRTKNSEGIKSAVLKIAVSAISSSLSSMESYVACVDKPLIQSIALALIFGKWPVHATYLNLVSKVTFRGSPVVYSEDIERDAKAISAMCDVQGIYSPTIFLHGPSGTGKTTFAEALGRANRKFISAEDILEGRVIKLPEYTTVVIDELDKIKKLEGERLTRLLRILDNKPKTTIVILTSNEGCEKFPIPLMRTCRVDKIMYIDYLKEHRAELLFEKLYGKFSGKAKKAFDAVNNPNGIYQPSAIVATYRGAISEAVRVVINSGKQFKQKKMDIGVIDIFKEILNKNGLY